MEQALQQCLQTFHAGGCADAFEVFGCHAQTQNGVQGYVFRVWAPNAQAVSVVGDFNFWNEQDLPMQNLGGGAWEAFSVYARLYGAYKYCIFTKDGRRLYKTDPYGNRCCTLPDTSSMIDPPGSYVWHDAAYRARVRRQKPLSRPVNIYEVHAGSWKQHPDGSHYSYTELADELIPYCKDMGYTHIELLPLMEYPYDPSWGYQITCYYAPTHRYGTPQQLMEFVDACHKAGLGVIFDWVPAHFPKDENGLYEFDGTCCYELSDPLMNEHPDWTTRIYDYGKPEVQAFLVSNAVYWLRYFHIDGIRVDAVASMLYLDYNRRVFRPNRFGGRENLEAIEFLRRLNAAAFAENPAAMMIAEESTAFPLITKPDYDGGLGFLFKWNMGWMNDMLRYMSLDPIYRKGDHNALTFSMTYAYSENYILPLSHDEVVHGKHSLIDRMPGSYEDKFSNLRVFFAYQIAHPGKKLNFMGNEFAQFIEWNYKQGLDWLLLGYEKHNQMHEFVRALNRFYLDNRPLWENDSDWDGFQWINPDDRDLSLITFRRIDRKKEELLVVCNFCPVLREGYRIGLPKPGYYAPVLCTDDAQWGGTGAGAEPVRAEKIPANKLPYSAAFRVPPMSVTFYAHKRAAPET